MASVLDTVNNLVTLAQLKNYLDVDSADLVDDNKLEYVINAASNFFMAETNRLLKARNLTEYYDGNESTELFLNQYPINSSAETIEIYTSLSVPRDYTDNQISSDYILIESEVGIVSLISDYFPKGKQTVKVVYNAGYASIPYDIQRAALELCALMWSKEKNKIDIVSTYSIQNANITIQADKAFNAFCQKVIDKYKRVNY